MNKTPIDVSLLLKSSSSFKAAAFSSSKVSSAAAVDLPFEIEPARVQIAPHSFAYACVSFTPAAMQTYSAFLEATLENVPVSLKHKTVQFEISGEGTLPRFSIVKPVLKNKRGQSLMLFKRCILNHTDTQALLLSNDGTLPAKVNFFFYDPDAGFRIRAAPNATTNNTSSEGLVMSADGSSIASVIIQPGAQVAFSVVCAPSAVQPYQASLQLTVTDNQFEDTLIQMIGEGF